MLLAILYLIIHKVTWRFYFIILLSRLNIFTTISICFWIQSVNRQWISIFKRVSTDINEIDSKVAPKVYKSCFCFHLLVSLVMIFVFPIVDILLASLHLIASVVICILRIDRSRSTRCCCGWSLGVLILMSMRRLFSGFLSKAKHKSLGIIIFG